MAPARLTVPAARLPWLLAGDPLATSLLALERQNLSIPLQLAGYDKIAVTVRFDGEKEPVQ